MACSSSKVDLRKPSTWPKTCFTLHASTLVQSLEVLAFIGEVGDARQQLTGSDIIVGFLLVLSLIIVLAEIITQIHSLEIQIILLRPKQLPISLSRRPWATSILSEPINSILRLHGPCHLRLSAMLWFSTLLASAFRFEIDKLLITFPRLLCSSQMILLPSSAVKPICHLCVSVIYSFFDCISLFKNILVGMIENILERISRDINFKIGCGWCPLLFQMQKEIVLAFDPFLCILFSPDCRWLFALAQELCLGCRGEPQIPEFILCSSFALKSEKVLLPLEVISGRTRS